MPEAGECVVCSTLTEHQCSGCQGFYYCSREHQKQDWKQHKAKCSPARVKEDSKLGRYLEATRNIKSGDIVMKEEPLITGPSQITPPVCLGCYKLLEEDNIVSCERCGWPFCSETCTLNEVHQPECFYTQSRGEKVSISSYGMPHPNYQCMTVLRCLYQRDHNQRLWKKLQALESHDEDRKNTEKWNNDKKMICQFIWEFFKLKDTFSEEEIMKCCGIVQINGHEVPLLEPEYIAVFDRVSMVEHSCRANCNKSFTSDGKILLYAGVNIPTGSHISVCYTDPLWGTEARRHHLCDWFFECACQRCSDVTEFGTMFSGIKCKKKDCKGYLLPNTFIIPILHKIKSPDPKTRGLDNKTWKCSQCGDEVADGIIQQLLQDIGKEISVMPKNDPDACERFINHCSSYLHPNHYYMTDVSVALAQMVGQQDARGLAGVTDDRLLVKAQLCEHIADLLETLAPAETRLRGSLLFELHAAVAETGRRKSLTEGPYVMLGYITIKSPDPKTRGLDNKTWKCSQCGDEVADGIIQQLLQDIGKEISVMPKNDPDACERFINHCSSYLHPNHYYMTDVSVALAQMVGQQDARGLAGVTDDRLLVKAQLCEHIADLLETLAPAETRLRGSLLFELHAAVAETGRRKSLTEGPYVMLGYITEARKILLQSARLLVNEPPELPEGRLAHQAKVNLVEMDELIKTLSAALPSPL